MKLRNILVPTDFSKFSDKAVEIALFLAEKYDANITLLHTVLLFQEDVNDEAAMAAYAAAVKAREAEIQKQLDRHAEHAGARGVTIESKLLRDFSAADAILGYIAENNPDLVVMGTHGYSGLKKWIYGSVAEKVVRLSPVPVLTTHYFDSPFQIRKILVPVDFSDYSQKAVAYARELAADLGAQTVFLHAIFQELHPAYFAIGAESLEPINHEVQQRSTRRLQEFVGDFPEASYVVTEGAAYQAIVDYARDHHIDLIVMATRGLTGLDHMLIGSTTERVVRLSEIPVLTIERRDVGNEAKSR